MKIKTLLIFLIIVIVIIFFIFYKGLEKSNIYTPKINIEKDIPFFKVKVFNTDKEINSREIFENDKFYLINIWASWCVPCREEHDLLMNLSKQTSIKIIGLNYKDDNKNAINFLKELGNPYKIILSDKDGTVAIELGAYGVPETFLIYDKKFIKRIIGPINDKLLFEIKELIQ